MPRIDWVIQMFGGVISEAVIRSQYNKLPRADLILKKEELAIDPKENYQLGSNPEREKRLYILNDALMQLN